MHSPGPLNSGAGPAERLFSAPLCGALSYPAHPPLWRRQPAHSLARIPLPLGDVTTHIAARHAQGFLLIAPALDAEKGVVRLRRHDRPDRRAANDIVQIAHRGLQVRVIEGAPVVA